MKIGKTGLLLLAVGIPVVLVGSLGMTRSQQFEEQKKLREELSVAKQRLTSLQAEKLSSSEKNIEKQLNETMAKLDTARATLSPPLSSISNSNRLLDIARSCGVTVIQIDSSGLTSSDLSGVKCWAISVKLTAEGEIPNLVNFVQRLNDEHASGTVESINISVPGSTDESKLAIPRISVQFNRYTYKGS